MYFIRDLYLREISSGVFNVMFGDAVWLLSIGSRHFLLTLRR